MVLLIADGPSFNFHVISYSKAGAWRALRKGWKIHLRQCGFSGTIEDALTVNVIENMQPDLLYRDYEPVKL